MGPRGAAGLRRRHRSGQGPSGGRCLSYRRSNLLRRAPTAGCGRSANRGSGAVNELSPTLEEFRKLAVERRVIPVYRRLLADAETAIGLYRKLARNQAGTYLLESAEQGVWSRYSFVGVRAAATLTEQGGHAIWRGHAPVGLPTGGGPLVAVAETLRLLHAQHGQGLPPFRAGLVGYISYDAVRRLERLRGSCVDDLGVPELASLLASDLAVLEHHSGEVWLVANAINFDNS